MNYLLEHLNAKSPKSLKVVSLLVKNHKHKMNFPIDYQGFEIGDDFVIGYGMDCDDKYRNLSSIQIYESR
ncbi:MAG: hypothetical protein IT569_08085 [Leptospiraceae bacterium]|nr:hypothetical protein [Leptospiraceae bacterium]